MMTNWAGLLLASVLIVCPHAANAQKGPPFPPPVPPCDVANVGPAYDFDSCIAPLDIVIPSIAPFIFQDVSSGGGDAPLVLRVTTLVTNSWFDATAPYHPTAVGVYSNIARRPPAEASTNANLNVALLYASYRVMDSLLPQRKAQWEAMLSSVGLDPNDGSNDTTTAVGIGNVAGAAVVAGRLHDGMNQTGDEDGRMYNPVPYDDYTGYEPVNTAFDLINPSKWQPDIQRLGMGLYKIQKFVTPQYARVEAYSHSNPQRIRVPPPIDSNHRRRRAYKEQADDVLAASANLTTEQKLKAELFDNKIEGLGFSALWLWATTPGMNLFDFIHLDFLSNMAAFDAGIVIWREKTRHDAVRPFSAIQHIYGDDLVTGYGGPGVGAVSMPANEWKSYLEEADHPEYPSASTCFCAAHAQSLRNFIADRAPIFDPDDIGQAGGFAFTWPAGSSVREPGVTPAVETTIVFPTWTEFVDDCGQSRKWAGVHFQAAIDESRAICDEFGDMAFDYFRSLRNGTAVSPRPPSQGQ